MKTRISLAGLARRASVMGTILLLATAGSLWAESPSELLEKGIYSEETKGDLEGAMKLYQQVVDEGKAGEVVAAQAQYRLGVCFYKKKQFSEASAAFDKLVQEFPNQKDLVAKAQEYLAGTVNLLPAPWVDGEEQLMDLKFASGAKVGVARLRVNAGETNGHKIWQLATYLHVGIAQISRVEVDADSFRPLHSYWKHSLLGAADAYYSPKSVTVKMANKEEPINVDVAGAVYDNEECLQLMRRLPLATNYSTSVRVLTSLGGGNIIGTKICVPAMEKIEVPAGSFECYRVELSIASMKQVFWYSADAHRYLVKFEGSGVTAELNTVGQHRPGQPVTYKDASCSLQAPSEWLIYATEPKSGKKPALYVLTPNGASYGEVWLKALDKVKPEAQQSLRASAEAFVAERADDVELKVRSDSWQAHTVAGQAGISFIADFNEGEAKKVGYVVSSFGPSSLVRFVLQAPAEDFESLRPQFDTVVNSFQWK